MLEIKNLHTTVDGKSILNGIDLTINPGEVHEQRQPVSLSQDHEPRLL